MSSRDTKGNPIARLSAVAIVLLAAGCQDYAARRDTIAFHAGEAAAYNKAVHVIDPWPAAAARTDMSFDGARAVRVIEQYETAGALAPPPPGLPMIVPPPSGAGQR